MKIRIYKQPSWFGIYHLVEKVLNLFHKDEDKIHSIAAKIDDTFPKLGNFFSWIHNKRVRKNKIIVESFDTWNADHTLALIIVPVLKKLAEEKHGSPYVENEDVPEELRSEDPADGTTSRTHFDKWNWVLNEMIWAFEYSLVEDYKKADDVIQYEIDDRRALNGRILFAKYFGALWD